MENCLKPLQDGKGTMQSKSHCVTPVMTSREFSASASLLHFECLRAIYACVFKLCCYREDLHPSLLSHAHSLCILGPIIIVFGCPCRYCWTELLQIPTSNLRSFPQCFQQDSAVAVDAFGLKPAAWLTGRVRVPQN